MEVQREIERASVEVGGTITVGAGVGIEKLEFMEFKFRKKTWGHARVRGAIRPANVCNPGKLLPAGKGSIDIVLAKSEPCSDGNFVRQSARSGTRGPDHLAEAEQATCVRAGGMAPSLCAVTPVQH